ncbi:hypothetical protein AMJ57_03270 [Parcubacteria bacterium SG8_24]|nr:MAG: hypothetical protein AMJ57_03270 [Parcubacteria bacterium SG8_24]
MRDLGVSVAVIGSLLFAGCATTGGQVTAVPSATLKVVNKDAGFALDLPTRFWKVTENTDDGRSAACGCEHLALANTYTKTVVTIHVQRVHGKSFVETAQEKLKEAKRLTGIGTVGPLTFHSDESGDSASFHYSKAPAEHPLETETSVLVIKRVDGLRSLVFLFLGSSTARYDRVMREELGRVIASIRPL